MMFKPILFLLFFTALPLYGQTKIQAWRLGASPSLMLTDKKSLAETNGALFPTREDAYLYIEEMVIPRLHTPLSIFASFTKNRYTSHIIIQVMDAFTDTELFQLRMDEPGSVPWDKLPPADRVYFIVRPVGSDIQLRAVGMSSEIISLVEESRFMVSPQILYADKDTLSVRVDLVQDASLTLFVYDSQGNITARLADKAILPAGSYEYLWDPSPYLGQLNGEDFQVWMQAAHPTATPVEITRTFRLIP